jgi:UDP-glucose 4-epimerase
MKYDIYSRVNQQILDGGVVGVSFCLAFLIRYEGAIPPYHAYQFWALFIPVMTGRMVTNYLFGLHRVQWRYFGFSEVPVIVRSYVTFSIVLLSLRFGLPPRAGISRLPASVITIELLLSLFGALSLRFVRRYFYERTAKGGDQPKADNSRRLLLIGAGIMGARTARELGTDPSARIVGFLDDDARKWGCIIAGARVLGPTSQVAEVVQRENVDSVLVCIAPSGRGSFNRLVALLDSMPVSGKFVPTIAEILDSKDGLHLAVGESRATREKDSVIQTVQQQQPVSPEVRKVRDKTVLITGGAGFIGSTLAERLAKDNQVVLVDRFFQRQPIAFTSLHKNARAHMIEADILNAAAINDWAREADIVIHAAAIVGVGRVCAYPRETLETNFTGTSLVLKALEKNSHLDRFVYFSTSEVFGVNSFRVHEDTPAAVGSAAEARWSYAIAKLAGEHLVKAYHRQTGMPVVTVRPFNIFGPRRLGAHAVLGFVLNALNGSPLEIHGDGSQIRSWCYIEDFCDAIMEMIARPRAVGEDFNIGNPLNTVTILQLAQEILEVTKSSASITFVESPFPDIEIRVPSLEKARQILDYQPQYDLRRALQLTVDWYRENLDYFESKCTETLAACQGR